MGGDRNRSLFAFEAHLPAGTSRWITDNDGSGMLTRWSLTLLPWCFWRASLGVPQLDTFFWCFMQAYLWNTTNCSKVNWFHWNEHIGLAKEGRAGGCHGKHRSHIFFVDKCQCGPILRIRASKCWSWPFWANWVRKGNPSNNVYRRKHCSGSALVKSLEDLWSEVYHHVPSWLLLSCILHKIS